MDKLFIVITDFNGFASTRSCLAALEVNRKQNYTVLVVDHGTTDATRIGLETEFPDVVRVVGSPELWWSGATNMGIRAARTLGAEAVMLLNNDCYITPNSVSALVEMCDGHSNSIVAPLQRDSHSGQFMAINPSSCLLLGFPTIGGGRNLTSAMTESYLLPVKLIIGGRGAIIPVTLFDKVGLFDEEKLPHYCADHDFYLRAQSKSISLYAATNVIVDVDNTNTTAAYNLASLSFSDFIGSLVNSRSHRNLTAVSRLIKAHYPVPLLYPLGIVLYLVRYLVVYAFVRIRYLMLN